MSFLPNDYKIPTTSDYMKFAQGKNKFRIIGSAIIGNEYWTQTPEGKRPVRKRVDENIPVGELGEEGLKHFWAFPVYNHNAGKIQILEVTQKGIMGSIKALIDDEDWGDPKQYDIVVTREGEGFDTMYSVMPSPQKPLSKEIQKQIDNTEIDMESFYDGGHPLRGGKTTKDLKEEPPIKEDGQESVNINDLPF